MHVNACVSRGWRWSCAERSSSLQEWAKYGRVKQFVYLGCVVPASGNIEPGIARWNVISSIEPHVLFSPKCWNAPIAKPRSSSSHSRQCFLSAAISNATDPWWWSWSWFGPDTREYVDQRAKVPFPLRHVIESTISGKECKLLHCEDIWTINIYINWSWKYAPLANFNAVQYQVRLEDWKKKSITFL